MAWVTEAGAIVASSFHIWAFGPSAKELRAMMLGWAMLIWQEAGLLCVMMLAFFLGRAPRLVRLLSLPALLRFLAEKLLSVYDLRKSVLAIIL